MIYPTQKACVIGWINDRHTTGRSKDGVLIFEGPLMFLRHATNPIARMYRRKELRPDIVLLKMDVYGFHHTIGNVSSIIKKEFDGRCYIIGVPLIQAINKAGHEAVADGYDELMHLAGRKLARARRFDSFWIARIKDIKHHAHSYSAAFDFPIELRDPKSMVARRVIDRITGVSS